MSIELKEARKKLDIVEKLETNPELILTDLFHQGVDGDNFLYQVNVNGKYILDYLIEHLSSIEAFKGCKLTNTSYSINTHELHIFVDALKYGEFKVFQPEDKIFIIDFDNRTYKKCTKDIKEYNNIINKLYEKDLWELSDFWKRYKNFTFKSRLHNAFISLYDMKKKFTIRFKDFLFTLVVPRRKIDQAVNHEINRISEHNELQIKYYNQGIEKQKYYKIHAPEHIEKLLSKQEEIEDFLVALGYKEDFEMSEW